MLFTIHNPQFALNIHSKFLNSNIESWKIHDNFEFNSQYNGCGVNDKYIDCRPSINALCYTGSDMKLILNFYNDVLKNNLVSYINDDTIDEEQFFTKELLDMSKRKNVIVNNSWVSHYAYTSQRPSMICYENNILAQYKQYANMHYNNSLQFIDI